MRIWIDIENPPQAQYMAPFQNGFLERNADVIVTARPDAMTVQVLQQHGIDAQLVGHSLGLSRPMKIAGIGARAAALVAAVGRRRPDMLLGTSRAAALAAATLRIPIFGFNDYEYADLQIARATRMTLFHPDVIPQEAYISRGIARKRLIAFPGLKEHISFTGINVGAIEPFMPRESGDELIRVLVRPAGEQTHYFVRESLDLTFEILEFLAADPRVLVLYSPRYPHQSSYLDRPAWKNEPILLEDAVPFVPLLKSSDLIVSAGGTMLREAAFLGVPAYSIFRSEIGHVDRHLESVGRLVLLTSKSDFDRVRLQRLHDLSILPTSASDLRGDVISQMLDRLPTRSRRRRPVDSRTRSSRRDS